MSSMRNAVARRNHKERSQPAARAKWGLLEKHKDYSLRAKDYNQKKQKLNILSAKSRERHPDEFAFGMLSADKGVQGKHGRGDQEKNQLSHATVQLLKTQDSGYLRTVVARGRREIDRLSERVAMDRALKQTTTGNERKIIFDEGGQPLTKKRRLGDDILDRAEAKEMGDMNGATIENIAGPNELPNESETENLPARPKSKKQLEREKEASTRIKAEKRRRKLLRERRAAKLVTLQNRQKQVLAAAEQLEIQRAKMSRAIGGTNKNGVKFKIRERKR